MQDPKHQLSPIERRMLSAIVTRKEPYIDFVAFHRLKAFGFITVSLEGRATITEEGKQALQLAQS